MSDQNNEMDTTEEMSLTPFDQSTGHIIRRDGSHVVAAGSTLLGQQLSTQRARRMQARIQRQQETVQEQRARVSIKLDDGTLKEIDPSTDEGRAELLKYNGVNIYKALDPEEAKKLPMRVRAGLDRWRAPMDELSQHYTPQEYLFPPADEVLLSCWLHSDPSNRAQAALMGLVNYVTYTPLLFNVASGRRPTFFHALSHEIYSCFANWMFRLQEGRPTPSQDEVDDIVDAVEAEIERSVQETGKIPQACPDIPYEAETVWIPVHAQDVQKLKASGVQVFVEEEFPIEGADAKAGDATIEVRHTPGYVATPGSTLVREANEEDMEVWGREILETTRLLSKNRDDRAVRAERTKALTNLTNFVLGRMFAGSFEPRVRDEWLAATQEQKDASDALDAEFESQLSNLPPLNMDALPKFVRAQVGDGSDLRVFRLILSLVPPPACDWDPASLNEDMDDDARAPIPDEVNAWMASVEKVVTPKPAVVEKFDQLGFYFDGVHPAVRAFYMMNPETTDIPPMIQRWMDAKKRIAARKAPEWFAAWWKNLFGEEMTMDFPAWMNDYMFGGIMTMLAMLNYYKQRAYITGMLRFLTKQLNQVLVNLTDVNQYLGIAGNLSTSMVTMTDMLLRIQEQTIVMLLGQSITPDHADVFLSKSLAPLMEFLEEDAPVEHWEKNGKEFNGPDYLNLQKRNELTKTQEALLASMQQKVSNTWSYEKIWELEGNAASSGAPENPVTLAKRGEIMVQALYAARSEESAAVYNDMIKFAASAVLPQLPSAHQKEVMERLLEHYEDAVAEQNADVDMEEGDIVVEMIDGPVKMNGKRRGDREDGGARKKRK